MAEESIQPLQLDASFAAFPFSVKNTDSGRGCSVHRHEV